MKFMISLFFATLFWVTTGVGDQTAITSDGRKVLLKDDSTWEYVKEVPKDSIHFDFRRTNWGMTKEQVKSTESGKLTQEDDDLLIYDGMTSGMDVFICYIFVDNKLTRSKYIYSTQHTNENDYIIDFKNIKESITQKYGIPKIDDIHWRDELYKDDPSQWGFAVSLGHLIYNATWETETTVMGLLLRGENYEINLSLEYKSKLLASLEKEFRQKEKSSEY
jgi:hypothetical protein